MQQPDGRACVQCKERKPTAEFSWKGPSHKRLTSRCHACRRANYKENPERNRQRARQHYAANRDRIVAQQRVSRLEDVALHLLRGARARAKAASVPFDLTKDDVVVPGVCPVLGIPLAVNEGKCGPNSPTVDRIRPERGYVRGNIVVVSHRANTIKSDATLRELAAVLAYYEPLLGPLSQARRDELMEAF